MSVLLIGDRDLVQLACFAADHLLLPAGLDAVALATRFRAANLEAWRSCYPNAPDPGLPRTPTVADSATDATSARDMLDLLRTTRDLRYNAEIESDGLLGGVLLRVAEQAAKARQAAMP
ncbi:hypothetical protein GCM10017620_24460 [Brevundimonas intermedia]|uniref:Uncharacterized protein n=1 Tax=Brevundimonas intermedia TaxID=74315 RepID=A0ABQ5TAR9_9CAUL|nr:hypothetical protein [Brevundimonas intermedia]GLK49473.1 hypothetical protein GCM10017620_24460 [Brevundimonas intermedia]